MLLNYGLRELISNQRGGKRTKRVRFSRRFKQRIYWRDGGCCVYCDRPVAFKDATMDHITPLVHGGKNRSKENIATSCKPCNRAKGPLELETMDDLAPDILWVKFDRMCEQTANRKGSFTTAACVF